MHRSEGSGTTYIFADFLAKVSPEWKSKVGVNSSVNWPTGIGSKGSDGVTGQVKSDPGRDRLHRADLRTDQQDRATARCKNAAGKFVKASTESVTAAAAVPQRSRCRLISACRSPTRRATAAYPISSFTWLLLYENPSDKAQAKVMVDFLKWALQDGQKFAPDMGYAPLPKAVVDLELKALAKIKTQ